MSTRIGQQVKVGLMWMLAKLDYDLVRRTEEPLSQYTASLIDRYGITAVIDVGANLGQFASRIRTLGWSGPLISIEPIPQAASALRRSADRDGKWEIVECAVGRIPGRLDLNVTRNSVSSSLLDPAEAHLTADPMSVIVGRQTVEVVTLDSILQSRDVGSSLFLKVDTQGYELEVLRGGSDSLARTSVLQVEVSLREVYHGAAVWTDLIRYIESCGFVGARVESAFVDPKTGDLLQADVVFVRPQPGEP